MRIPSKCILVKDDNNFNRSQKWNHRSVIGMMTFLAPSTRPDILFSGHQCAKFTSCSKQSHEEAVKWIGKYLKRTQDKDIIMRPDKTDESNYYIDADFVGSFLHETMLETKPLS